VVDGGDGSVVLHHCGIKRRETRAKRTTGRTGVRVSLRGGNGGSSSLSSSMVGMSLATRGGLEVRGLGGWSRRLSPREKRCVREKGGNNGARYFL
jgi:hypothetical protein